MRVVWQIVALVALALTSALIVFVVNAPKWMDGTTRPATSTAR